jgi:hypothetical protein
MRQAIVTKYLCPTNTRGSRIAATCAAGRIVVQYDYGNEDQHAKAAEALARKLEWFGEWFQGGMKGTGSCFVMREFKSSAQRGRFYAKKIVKVHS